MRKIFLFLLILAISNSIYGQFVCKNEHDITRFPGYGNISNGGVFTPKGDLRVLIIFISYGDDYDYQEVNGWPQDSAFPNWATNIDNKAFYTTFLDFSNDIYSDPNRFSVSNFYYQMSNGSFRLLADYYPRRVIVDNVLPTDDWGSIHLKALQKISDSVNWSLYDNRKNSPNYEFDNSTSQPDNAIDYIIFCHRFSWNWQHLPSQNLSLEKADGATSVFIETTVGHNYSVKRSSGFTFFSGGRNIIASFPHEVGHDLYDGPHYAGANHVVGRYFYEPTAGWGMMHLDNNYTCAAGWERYILNWVPDIKANGVNAKIENVSDLAANNGVFLLRDFITTGDAIRIRVPAGDGIYQYLWLENHQCKSTFDGNMLENRYCEEPIDEYKRGLVAYVESYSHVKDTNYIDLYDSANGVRWLSKNGDHDFGFGMNSIQPFPACSNLVTHPFYSLRENPIGGQSVGELIRHDFDNDGQITYNKHSLGSLNNTAKNEGLSVVKLDTLPPTAKYLTGTGMQFQMGDKVGIARNPCVRNIPKYDSTAYLMGDYYLNGISFEILLRLFNGNMLVKVRMDDVAIDQDVRWAAASIILTDITGDSRPDVDVRPTITVNIDKSGTPNRHKNPANPNQTSSTVKDFITPTTFTCRNGSYFKQDTFSIVNVKDSSTLVLESGSIYEIGDHASLNIDSSGTLIVKSGATLRVKGTGHVEINKGAYICIEDGANIELVNVLSSVNLRHGYNLGVNPDASSPAGNCTSTPLTSFALASGSTGQIHDFSTNRYIQRTTYYRDAYVAGNNIWAGSCVLPFPPYGNVNLENGSHVILDADGDVHLEFGVNVKLGATLEIR